MTYHEKNNSTDPAQDENSISGHVNSNTTKPNETLDPDAMAEAIVPPKKPLSDRRAGEFIVDAKRRLLESATSINNTKQGFYQILAECFDQANRIAIDPVRRKEFERCWNLSEKYNKKPFPDAPYFSAVIKLVFSDARKQSGYIKVLTAAHKEKKTYEEFVGWVIKKKGIEAIRLESSGAGGNRASRLQNNISSGQTILKSRTPIIKNVQPGNNFKALNNLMWVTVYRRETDGTISQVWNCTDPAVLNKVHEAAHKEFGATTATKPSEDTARAAVKAAVDSTTNK